MYFFLLLQIEQFRKVATNTKAATDSVFDSSRPLCLYCHPQSEKSAQPAIISRHINMTQINCSEIVCPQILCPINFKIIKPDPELDYVARPALQVCNYIIRA